MIAIGANGDGVLHWRHYVHHHWIAIGTIYCRHWRQWREPQIIMTLLPSKITFRKIWPKNRKPLIVQLRYRPITFQIPLQNPSYHNVCFGAYHYTLFSHRDESETLLSKIASWLNFGTFRFRSNAFPSCRNFLEFSTLDNNYYQGSHIR